MDDGQIDIEGAWATPQPLPGGHSSFLTHFPISIPAPSTHFPSGSCRDGSKTQVPSAHSPASNLSHGTLF